MAYKESVDSPPFPLVLEAASEFDFSSTSIPLNYSNVYSETTSQHHSKQMRRYSEVAARLYARRGRGNGTDEEQFYRAVEEEREEYAKRGASLDWGIERRPSRRSRWQTIVFYLKTLDIFRQSLSSQITASSSSLKQSPPPQSHRE